MKYLFFSFCVLILFSCSKQSVSFDYDRNQDFSKIRDYSIEFGEGSISEFNVKRLQTAVENEFSAKGVIFNPYSANRVLIQGEEYITQEQSSNVGIGMGGGGGNVGMGAGIDIPLNSKVLVQNYTISLYNPASELVWEGYLDMRLPSNSKSEAVEASINKGVQKLFRNFPPKK